MQVLVNGVDSPAPLELEEQRVSAGTPHPTPNFFSIALFSLFVVVSVHNKIHCIDFMTT